MAQIAIDAGFLYGAQLPATVYYPIHFADQDWKRPNRAAYMAALAQHRPHMATVLDWESEGQIAEVMGWAEEAAPFVQQIVIVPKVQGGIARIPARIAGRDVILGYSVPTRYGGTELPLWEFGRRPVHLLGGSPHRQMELAHYLNVVSADGNYANLKATKFCEYWNANRWYSIDAAIITENAPYEAFRRSCQNIMAAWQEARQVAIEL